MKYDVFISHASEDKREVATPLADRLKAAGLKVWLDASELSVGDGLRGSIDEALTQSRFGVAILSQPYFTKEWTRRELGALIAMEDGRGKVLLPVLHGITKEYVLARSPILADRLWASTEGGIEQVAEAVIRAIQGVSSTNPDESPKQSWQQGIVGEPAEIRNELLGKSSRLKLLLVAILLIISVMSFLVFRACNNSTPVVEIYRFKEADKVTDVDRFAAPFVVNIEGEAKNTQKLYVYLVVDDGVGEWIQPGLGLNYSGAFKENCYLGEEKAPDSLNREYRVFAVVTSEEHMTMSQLRRATVREWSRTIRLIRTRT